MIALQTLPTQHLPVLLHFLNCTRLFALFSPLLVPLLLISISFFPNDYLPMIVLWILQTQELSFFNNILLSHICSF